MANRLPHITTDIFTFFPSPFAIATGIYTGSLTLILRPPKFLYLPLIALPISTLGYSIGSTTRFLLLLLAPVYSSLLTGVWRYKPFGPNGIGFGAKCFLAGSLMQLVPEYVGLLKVIVRSILKVYKQESFEGITRAERVAWIEVLGGFTILALDWKFGDKKVLDQRTRNMYEWIGDGFWPNANGVLKREAVANAGNDANETSPLLTIATSVPRQQILPKMSERHL